jgi:hypothetical protein
MFESGSLRWSSPAIGGNAIIVGLSIMRPRRGIATSRRTNWCCTCLCWFKDIVKSTPWLGQVELPVSQGMLISQDCTKHLAACALDFVVTISIMPIQNIGFLTLSIYSKTKYKELLSIHHHTILLDKSKATAIP